MKLIKLSEAPKIIQLIVAAGALAVAMAAIMVPTVWALDTRYVTAASVEQSFISRDIRDVRRMIRKLEWLEKHGKISAAEEWDLEGLRIELEELQDEQEAVK